MKGAYAFGAAVCSVAVGYILAAFSMPEWSGYWALIGTIATMGGFICHAILSLKDKD